MNLISDVVKIPLGVIFWGIKRTFFFYMLSQ